MQKTRKILALILTLCVLCTVCACSKKTEGTDAPQTETAAPESTKSPEIESAATPDPATDGEKDTSSEKAPAENAGDSDEEAVRAVLDSFANTMKKGDIQALSQFVKKDSPQYKKYIDYNAKSFVGNGDSLGIAIDDALANSFANDIFSRYSLAVQSVHVDGEKASAALTAKLPDLENLGNGMDTEAMLSEYMKEISPKLESLAGNPEELEKFQASLFENFAAWLLPKMLASTKTVEKDITAALEKTDGKWIITNMDSIF